MQIQVPGLDNLPMNVTRLSLPLVLRGGPENKIDLIHSELVLKYASVFPAEDCTPLAHLID